MKAVYILHSICLKLLPHHVQFEVMKKIMDVLATMKSIQHYSAIAGLNVITQSAKSNSGTIFCMLKPWDERKDKSEQINAIIAELNGKFAVIRRQTFL